MMVTAGHGVNLLSAMSGTLISFICYAFVDDTDVVHAGSDVYTSGEDVMREMQVVVDRWEGGLRATGGALVPSKSYWYMIDFKWSRASGSTKPRKSYQENYPFARHKATIGSI